MTQSAVERYAPAPRDTVVEDLVNAFLHVKADSPHTARGYKVDLWCWITWCRERGVDPLNTNRAVVRLWLADRREVGDAEATRKRRLSGVSSWYKYLNTADATIGNPADIPREARPQVDRHTSHSLVLSTEQSAELIAQADADGPRSAFIVALLVYTGIRVGEMLSADVTDITEHRGHPILQITGKGRRTRLVPIPPDIWDRSQAYLATRVSEMEVLPALTVGAKGPRPLLLGDGGKRLDLSAVRRLIKRLALRCGGSLAAVVDRLSPHVFRHSYCTDMLDEGVPLRDVQLAMGHASPDTTLRYDHYELDPMRHPNYRRSGQLTARRR